MKLNDKDLVSELNKELKYLLFEAPPEEYNPDAVEAIISLLHIKGSKNMTNEIEKIEYIDNASSRKDNKISVRGVRRPNPIIRVSTAFIAAAILIPAILIIGLDRPVNADTDTGFFHWLQKDEKGVSYITNPQAYPKSDPEVIESIDQGPLTTIQNVLYEPQNLPAGMCFVGLEYSETQGPPHFMSRYENTDGQWIEVGISTEDIEGYQLNEASIINEAQVAYYSSADGLMIIYQEDNIRYFVRGNLLSAELNPIMDGYIEFVKDNLK